MPGEAVAMPDMPPSAAPDCLHVTLRRGASRPGWQAELHDAAGLRRFESLTDLMDWLATLDRPPPPAQPPLRGIR
jgi:hypothetical protein